MKKSVLNLGKALTKAAQKQINGGAMQQDCGGGLECPRGYECHPTAGCVRRNNEQP